MVLSSLMHLFHLLAIASAAVKLDFIVHEHSDDTQYLGDLSKRNTELVTPATHEYYNKRRMPKVAYLVEIEVGSNRDKVIVQMSTMTDKLIVFKKGGYCYDWSRDKEDKDDKHSSPACQSKFGAYDPERSTSYNKTVRGDRLYFSRDDDEHNDEYGGGYCLDDVTLNGLTSEKQVFLLAGWMNSHWGTLGLAYQNVSQFDDLYTKVKGYRTGEVHVPSFLTTLNLQGRISKKLYSIYYANDSASSGSVLFGGVDTAKIASGLTTLPLIVSENSPSVLPRFQVDSVSLNNRTIAGRYYSVWTLSHSEISVPTSLYYQIRLKLGVRYEHGLELMACPASTTKLVFNFGGSEVGIPVTHLVTPFNGTHCVLNGIAAYSRNGDYIQLGHSFLRFAYMVVDYDALEVSIGPVKFTTNEEVVEVEDNVPLATRAADWNTTFQDFSHSADWNNTFDYATDTLTTDYWPYSLRGESNFIGTTMYSWVLMVLAMI
ncbi:hypothetical protein DICA1_C01662 [Diutina catenulata]